MPASIKLLAALALLAFTALGGGCMFFAGAAVGAGAATGTTLYAEGSLTDMLDKDTPRVAEATKAAFQDLGIVPGAIGITPAQAGLEGTYPGGDSVRVTIESQGEHVSKIWIRVAFWGDEAKSLAIYNKIKAHLM